ncbi:esterase/lipase family protein [Solimonas marina]|uniref:GPI inositol-deacylase PGAP1-like alpha/beta domain-containing protein n=1 Tax=Solimonas marina TaxID=2714601 RepID=A0A969W9E8_9GAMM|nr:alpha/beta fold hydrolase [Solimonas marina]NKF22334.1 hypothetical protein [Solimonas marina]
MPSLPAIHHQPTPRLPGAIELAADVFDRTTEHIHAFHRAIAARPFAPLQATPALGHAVAPIRVLHDGITDAVYRGVRDGGAIGFGVATGIARLLARRDGTAPPAAAPHLDTATSALAGLIGDHLAGRRNPLAPRFGLYRNGLCIGRDADSLRRAYPDAQPRLALFVHGLCCNESSWQLYRDPSRPETRGYGERLQAIGYTPLYLRYNTGAHISQNAERLARLMKTLDQHWPVPVEEIVLIGHSMGGLILRAAAAAGLRRSDAWTRKVHALFCLGSPHLGAPLEKGVQALTEVLQTFDLSRPWAGIFEARSVGIRDLRHGATSSADWRRGVHAPQRLAQLPGVRYHFIGSSMGRDANDLIGHAVGDGLVRLPSAQARKLADADTATLFRRHHMHLLNDPEVGALIEARLLRTRPQAAASRIGSSKKRSTASRC